MNPEKEELSEQEKHEAALELLSKLKKKLHSIDISNARRAAYNLSWMQEDGLEILKETLFGNFAKTAKKAAAYGLRSMHGRMKKMASDVLKEGLGHHNRITRDACERSLFLMEGGAVEKGRAKRKSKSGRIRIREIARKRRTVREVTRRRTRPDR
ncbi:MAG: hypothetical protein ACYTBJ_20955 [Planctomycetota bacterium]|jgi:hypothetical protein